MKFFIGIGVSGYITGCTCNGFSRMVLYGADISVSGIMNFTLQIVLVGPYNFVFLTAPVELGNLV